MKITNVVAAIINKDNLFFIAQRNKNKHMGLKWEFPGGKVELGETLEEALIREIKEELNIKINVNEKVAQERFKDDIININLHYFLCIHESGKLKLTEHENYAWVERKDFKQYIFVEGDNKILPLL